MLRIRLLLLAFLLFNLVAAQSSLRPKKMANGKFGYVDNSMSPIIDPVFDKAFAFDEGLAKVIVNGKWGLIDTEGNFIAKARYDYIGWYDDPYYKRNQYNIQLINNPIPSGQVFLPSESNTYAYLIHGLWGLMENGKTQKVQWDKITSGAGGHFSTYSTGKGWTWIDKDGKAVDVYFNSVKPLKNGMLACTVDSIPGLMVYDAKGNRIGNSTFDEISSLNQDYMKARKNKLWGVIDKSANWIAEPDFDDVQYNHWNNALQYLPSSNWHVSKINIQSPQPLDFDINYSIGSGKYTINRNDSLLVWNSFEKSFHEVTDYDSVSFENSFYGLHKSSEEGFYPYSDSWTLIYKYPVISISELLLGKFYVVEDAGNNKLALIDKVDSQVILHNISWLKEELTSYGFLLISRNDRLGVYQPESRKWIIEPFYFKVEVINDSLFAGQGIDSVFLFDQKGGIVNSIEAIDFSRINDSTIGLNISGKGWRITNLELEPRLNYTFSALGKSNDNYLPVKRYPGWGIINLRNGKMVLRNQYDSISDFQNGYRIVSLGEKSGIINAYGNFTYPMNEFYEAINPFEQDWTKAFHNGLAGLIDQNGILKVSSQYEDFDTIIFDHIPFKFRSKWGLLDLKESIVMQPLNDSLRILENGKVMVWKNGKVGIKNFIDKELIQTEFDEIIPNGFGAFIVIKDGKYGYYNKSFRQVRPAVLDGLIQFKENLIAVKKSNSWKLIDDEGKPISQKRYTGLFYNKETDEIYYKEKKSWIIQSLD